MKEYQVLISGILIALAIYLGLTHTQPDPYEGAIVVPEPKTSYDACVAHAKSLGLNDIEALDGCRGR